MTVTLRLLDQQTFADLGTFVARARRLEADGAARLVGHGQVLAVYVSPLHGGGGPTVLGLRTLALASPCDLDVTVPLAALGDRLAVPPAGAGDKAGGRADDRLYNRVDDGAEDVAEDGVALAVPPMTASGAGWAGMSPPRSGWDPIGLVDPGLLRRVAADGIARVAAGTPDGAGAQAVARLRALIWGEPVPGLDDVPAGVAFAAEALGFLNTATDNEPAALLRRGPWVRLTTATGHVLGRRSPLG